MNSSKPDAAQWMHSNRLAGLSPISRYEYALFKELLYNKIGIELNPAKVTLLESRLGSRVVRLGHSTLFDYYQQVVGDEEELQVLVDLVTTNETFFFRELAHFDYLGDSILPTIGHRPLRVWSAASSSGEETYSLGMLLHDKAKNQNWELIGSDISKRMLQKAATGHYQMLRHEGIPLEYLKRYCLRGTGSEEGTMLITQEMRNRVQFCQINLNGVLSGLGQFDIIFLRNVLIYFSREKKADIVKRVVRQLKPGGYLFISHTENLQGIDVNLTMRRPSIFQKKI